VGGSAFHQPMSVWSRESCRISFTPYDTWGCVHGDVDVDVDIDAEFRVSSRILIITLSSDDAIKSTFLDY
jgi:hypothetical protein